MRLCSRNLRVEVTPIPEMSRPIQMRIGGLIYTLTPLEAIELSNNLTDAVEHIEQGAPL